MNSSNQVVKNLELIQTLARKHLGEGQMDSSARSCLAASIALSNKEAPSEIEWQASARQAVRSLAYSVGICHPDYSRAFKASGISGEVRCV